jgi:phage terminase large subunit
MLNRRDFSFSLGASAGMAALAAIEKSPTANPKIPTDLRPMDRSDPVERVALPYTPRSVFLPYHNRSKRFAVIVAHRRCGKTVAEVNECIKICLSVKRTFPPPQVAFVSPTFGQGKRNAWLYAKHYTRAIPGMKFLEAETTLVFPHEGRLILIGSDNYDSLRGVYLDHAALDEYAIQDPRVWGEVIRASLSEYAGSATFIGSAKGRNHFYDIIQEHKDDPDWLMMTLKASQTGILSDEELELARRAITPEEYAQEYECNFDAAVRGTFYGQDVERAENEKRITSVSYDTAAPVYAAMDLGIGGATAIWIYQLIGNEVHFLKFVQDKDQKLSYYVDWIMNLPYQIQTLYLPHDAEQREYQTGLTRTQFLEQRGLRCFVLPKASEDGGISAVRVAFSRFWFDKTQCHYGIECLRMFRRAWDAKKKVFSDNPFNDWSTHGADAMRYVVQSTPYARNISDWSIPIRRNLRVVA